MTSCTNEGSNQGLMKVASNVGVSYFMTFEEIIEAMRLRHSVCTIQEDPIDYSTKWGRC